MLLQESTTILESEQVSPAPGSLITRLSKPQSQEQRWEVQPDPTAHQFLFSSWQSRWCMRKPIETCNAKHCMCSGDLNRDLASATSSQGLVTLICLIPRCSKMSYSRETHDCEGHCHQCHLEHWPRSHVTWLPWSESTCTITAKWCISLPFFQGFSSH